MAIIYKHTCLITGKCYIGQTVKTIMQRWNEHQCDIKYAKRRKFFAALAKYPEDCWTHEILFESDDPEIINDKEIEYIKLFDSVKNGYNTSYDRFRTNALHRPESIELMKESQKAAHARRREEGRDGGWKRKDGGPMKGKEHPNKGGTCANKGKKSGMTWEEIFGVEGATKRREAHKLRRLNKEVR